MKKLLSLLLGILLMTGCAAIHSDFRTQEEEICHCFHYSPFYLL